MAIKFLSAIDHGAYQLPTADGSNGQVLTTDGNGNITFQTVPASSNFYLSGASFNTGNGILTLTVNGATDQTVDLDGRYALSSHSHNYDNYGSWNLKTNGTQRTTVQSGGVLDLVAGSNVALSYSAGGKVTISSTDTNTVYTHPNYNGDDFSVDSGVLTGATVISDIDINVTTDTLGHVTDANGTVSTRTLTLGDLGYTGATNANYITNNNQLTNGAGYITSVPSALSVTSLAVAQDITATGGVTAQQYTASSSLPRLRLNDTANGTQAIIELSNDRLFIVGPGTDYITMSAVNNVGIGVLDASEKLQVNGNILANGDVIAFSDRRTKDNIETIPNALDKVNKMRGVLYNKKSNGEASTGVIAQEIEEILPQVVKTDNEGMKSVAYGNIVGVLIEAIKEQQEIISQLEERIVDLENKI